MILYNFETFLSVSSILLKHHHFSLGRPNAFWVYYSQQNNHVFGGFRASNNNVHGYPAEVSAGNVFHLFASRSISG